MSTGFIFSFGLHAICEIAAAWAFVFWISEIWSRVPAPALVRLARHPAHLWIACGMAIVPAVFGTILTSLVIAAGQPVEMSRLLAPLFYLFSFFYGALFGLTACCCAGAGERFRLGAAFLVSAALVLAPPWHLAPRFLYLSIHGFFLLLIIVIANLILWDKKHVPTPFDPSAGTPPPVPHKSSPLPALLVGFLPAIFVLITITVGVSGISDHMSDSASHGLLWLASIASVGCCIVSSFLLFKRKTGAAIAGAILLLLLNLFLAFFFGCCASLRPGDFR